MALIASDQPCRAAGVFTTNRVKAAPVLYDQEILAKPEHPIRAVIVNAGNANACTGDQGMADSRRMAQEIAQHLGCAPDEVLVLSTGVIGVPMPMDKVSMGIDAAANALLPDGWDAAAQAIMTTDTRPKIATITTKAGYTLTGIAKGAGMIAPNMATMLALVATDADVSDAALGEALRAAAGESFNRIVIDGDMSTNDTLLLLANGASGVKVGAGDPAFLEALKSVCIDLAQKIVRDGEGVTKFVTLHVTGAPTHEAARTVADSIARSPLCKTAFYGGDPNWGRVVAAAGYSGVEVAPERMALWLLDAAGQPAMQLVERGQGCDYDEPAAIALMQGPEWGFRLDLGLGGEETTVWTCDISHDYVSINGHYRT
jgi:glutamate N-acetyltransferase/amino-acid N-acetyltransferase